MTIKLCLGKGQALFRDSGPKRARSTLRMSILNIKCHSKHGFFFLSYIKQNRAKPGAVLQTLLSNNLFANTFPPPPQFVYTTKLMRLTQFLRKFVPASVVECLYNQTDEVDTVP